MVLKAVELSHLDLRLRYIDAGTADTAVVLLMHGIPAWSYLYRDAIVRLVNEDDRVIAPVFLGLGLSDRRGDFDRSFHDEARAMTALRDALTIESVHVVGNDTGGAVTLTLAIEHATRVDRLVVCNAVGFDRFDNKTRPLDRRQRDPVLCVSCSRRERELLHGYPINSKPAEASSFSAPRSFTPQQTWPF